MKSGIKSMGESAYATVMPANIFAGIGVSLSFNVINKAGIALFSFFARVFNKLIIG